MQTLEDLLKEAQELNKAKKYSEVIELLPDEVLELYQNAKLRTEKYNAYISLGEEFQFKNDNTKVFEAYNQAISTDPTLENGYYLLAMIYSDLGKIKEAISILEDGLERVSNSFLIYFGLGYNYYLSGNYNKSIENYTRALEIRPDNYTFRKLGNVYKRMGKFDDALTAYNTSIELDPNYNYVFYCRASVFKAKQNYKAAIRDYEKYIELTNNDSDYHSIVAQSKIEELKKIIDNLDYGRISELVGKIKELLLFKRDCVTHYTSLSTAKKLIFDKSKFWLSEGTFLNDTSEGRELFKFLPSFDSTSIITNDTIALPFTQKPFIGSFVTETNHDDLTLWRMYGKENKDEAKGCAITLYQKKLLEDLKESLIADGKSEMNEKMNEEFNFYRVAYRMNDLKKPFIIHGANKQQVDILNEYLFELNKIISDFNLKEDKKPSDIQNIQELLNSIAFLFKSAEYQYEHELRLVVEGIGFKKIINTESTQPRVYIELVPICPFISKITLGPKVERAEEWAAAFYYSLDQQDYHPEILISHLPFK